MRFFLGSQTKKGKKLSLRLFCFPINNAATLPNRFPIHFLIEEEESLFFNQQTIRLIYGFMQTEIAHYAGDAKTIEAEDAGERGKTRSFWCLMAIDYNSKCVRLPKGAK